MADQTVGELIRAQDIGPTDLFVLEQSGVAKSLTGQILINWMTRYADGHGGIQTIEKTKTQGLVDTYRITMADTTTFDFPVTNGRSITSITKTGTSGLTDTYTIAYNSGAPTTFAVTNGAKGDKGDNVYLWIKYASQKPSESSHSMGDVPDSWIGVYAGTKSSAPSVWSQYKWFQWKGNQGDPGTPATLVSSKTEYQLSGNGTAPPSGSWSASIPVVPQGSFLWTRTTQQYNTGSPVVSYSVARFGIDGKGSVSTVCQKSPTPDGNVEISAADVDALPITGGAMQGEIDMRSYSLTGLGDASRDGDAVSLKYARGHYAQSSSATVNNLNVAVKNGWYSYGSGATGAPTVINAGALFVMTRTGSQNQVVQFAHGVEGGSKGCSAIRHSSNNGTSWDEWEYINPPMTAGVEYRTTELYNNLPVYTTIIDGGAIPSANSQKFVNHNKAVNQIVRYDISTNAYGTAVPGFSFSGSASQDFSIYGGANQNGVFLAVKSLNWTQFKWWVQIWYTK